MGPPVRSCDNIQESLHIVCVVKLGGEIRSRTSKCLHMWKDTMLSLEKQVINYIVLKYHCKSVWMIWEARANGHDDWWLMPLRSLINCIYAVQQSWSSSQGHCTTLLWLLARRISTILSEWFSWKIRMRISIRGVKKCPHLLSVLQATCQEAAWALHTAVSPWNAASLEHETFQNLPFAVIHFLIKTTSFAIICQLVITQ